MESVVAVDIETRPDGTPFCIGFCNEKLKFAYYRWSGNSIPAGAIRRLEDPTTTKVFHNASFDIGKLKQMGVNVKGTIHDTYIMAHIEDQEAKSKGLKQLAIEHLGSDRSDAQEVKYFCKKTRLGYDSWDKAKLKAYNKKDVVDTMKLYYLFKDAMKSPVFELEHKLLPVIIHMEEAGIRIDLKKCEEIRAAHRERLDKLRRYFKKRYQLENPNSSKQLSELIYKRLKIPQAEGYKPKYKSPEDEAAQPSTDALALILIQMATPHPIIPRIQEYRKLSTVEHFFLKPFTEKSVNGFVYPSFNQLGQVTERGVRTGRFSSSKPNFQNIKRGPEIRQLVIPRRRHYLISLDYKQIEMVLYAYLANDQTLIKAYKKGLDIHMLHKTEFVDPYRPDHDGKNRMIAKHIGFEIIYGIGAPGMTKFLHKQDVHLDVETVRDMLEQWHYKHPALQKLKGELYRQWHDHGGIITDLYGREYILPYSRFYIAVNYMMQGMAANIIKDVMPDVCEFMQAIGGRLLMTIHDELVCEPPYKAGKPKAVAEEIARLMRKPGDKLSIPLEAEYTICLNNWGEAA